jgi:hypothetical protein
MLKVKRLIVRCTMVYTDFIHVSMTHITIWTRQRNKIKMYTGSTTSLSASGLSLIICSLIFIDKWYISDN